MKTRTGFVSNSSSSSFCLVVTEAGHEKACKDLHPYVRQVIEYNAARKDLAGTPVLVVGDACNRSEGYFGLQSPDWEGPLPGRKDDWLIEEGASECFYQYKQAIRNLEASEYLTWSADF